MRRGQENVPYLDVVHGVLALAFLRHQSLALLSEVGAHALAHGFQSIGHSAEQLIHARQVCGHTECIGINS